MEKVFGAVIATIVIIYLGMALFGESFLYIGIPSVVVGFVVAVGIIIYEEIKELKKQMEKLSKVLGCTEKSNGEVLTEKD